MYHNFLGFKVICVSGIICAPTHCLYTYAVPLCALQE